MYGSNFGIVQLGKALIILVLLTVLRNKATIYGCCLLLLVFLARELSILFYGDTIYLHQDLTVFFRFSFLFVYLGVFYQLKDGYLINRIEKLFAIICVLQSLSIIAGFVFHIELFRAYQYRAGYKGLFYGINDVAFFMIMAYLYGLVRFIERRKVTFLLIMLIASSLLALGSRGTLAGLIIIPCVYFSLVVLFRKKTRVKLLFISVSVVIACLVALYIFEHLQDVLQLFFAQSLIVYNRTGNFLTAFMSMRNVTISEYLGSVHNPLQILFGLQLPSHKVMVESDIFDFMMRLGVVGTTIYIYVVTRLSKLATPAGREAIISLWIIIILMGTFMGHVMLSSLNAPWLAFFLILYSKRFDLLKEHSQEPATSLT